METIEQRELRPLTFLPGCNTPGDITSAQVRINVERHIQWLDLEPLKERPLVIVAGGPSLESSWLGIPLLGGDILALNNAYGFLLERGITPDYFMLMDARPENIDFLKTKSETTRHFLAAQVHPSIFDALSTSWVNLFLTTHPDSLTATEHILDKPKHRLCSPVGTVGIKALSLAYALGYRELHLFGYDSSYSGEQHHGFTQALNDEAKTIDVYLSGKEYRTTPALAHQATEFCDLAAGMTRMGFDIQLHCSGLLPDLVAHGNREAERPLEEREREKYERIWAEPSYRKYAPGEHHIESAVSGLGMKPGDSLIDFGCGCGRGAQRLKDLGFQVTGIDHAANCLDPHCTFDFMEACLWDLPKLHAAFGYCTDVMEHIPSEKVEQVLAGIARSCDAAYFSISTVDDSCGSLIGQKLHMTIMDAANWNRVMGRFWGNVSMIEQANSVQFIARNPIP